jgi:hypothetical protein
MTLFLTVALAQTKNIVNIFSGFGSQQTWVRGALRNNQVLAQEGTETFMPH